MSEGTEKPGTSRTLRSGGGIEAEANLKMWERLKKLIEESFINIEAWVKDKAFPETQQLAVYLGGNLTSHDHLWNTMEQVDLVASNCQVYSKRISNIENLIYKMEDEVISAPAALLPEDKNSYTAQQFQVRVQQGKLEIANQAFYQLEACFKRLKSQYEEHANPNGTPHQH